MIDWHTHILEGMDDGSQSREMTCQMIQTLREMGAEEIFATPHYNLRMREETPAQFVQRREESYRGIKEEEFASHVHLGAEVALSPDLMEMKDLQLLKLGATSYILLEPPYEDFQEWLYQLVFRIQGSYHLIPVIAHVDRYLGIVSNEKQIWRLYDMGCVIQFNTSVAHKPRLHPVYRLMKKCDRMIFGTDSHNLTSRPPRIEEQLLKKKLGEKKWNEVNRYSEKMFGRV